MLIHPWDAPIDDDHWRAWLRDEHDFGQLIAPGRDREFPVVVPTHFVFRDDAILLHLARPNPVWAAVDENPRVLLTVVGDYTYIRSHWNGPVSSGVPTSYYATVQLECDARVVDCPSEKASLLNAQLDHFEPGSSRCPVSASGVDGRLLPGIRGLVLSVTGVRAKFKFGGNKSVEHRGRVASLLVERGDGHDAAVVRHLAGGFPA
ncbi:FMN-binding negative transcriptional regulator [Allokutzneria sp. A3M-2-11 16]|uniref:FMN-binding negative transcriptional regulator n=1 Tax=Allokutzneria sp. A3M-2-11 16 TaxID=2962043 RepID=UPI0020B70B81|nr:FMN-binding negative transcriptional regulator [Allokutzneria sp. A3M-2-11 16]MCP3804424.1 FMN-binding negative transcriptional regulator [Allokutzneria sp. A3M-2-11 16]